LKSQGLEIARAKCASVANIDNYIKELITKYGLKDKPHLIFNVDEKGISPDHSPQVLS
jgi:FMN phosphatase YigB (HAD superfamily)